MENYIVRIYRRQSGDPESITGIVERPDNNESKHFSSIYDLVAIFVPQRGSKGQSRRKQVIEHRKYRRFAINECTLVFDSSSDVGEIVDISMGGLSFICPDIPEKSTDPVEVGILCGEDGYFTEKIQCRKLMGHGAAGDSTFNTLDKDKRYSIVFGELTPKQRLDLEYIIQKHAGCEI